MCGTNIEIFFYLKLLQKLVQILLKLKKIIRNKAIKSRKKVNKSNRETVVQSERERERARKHIPLHEQLGHNVPA